MNVRGFQFALAALLFAVPSRPQDGAFIETVYPMLEKAQCRMCHNDNGVSSATRLLFPPEDAPPAAVRVFGFKLAALVDKESPEQSLLVRKPTMRVAHAGGERIAKGSPGEKSLIDWAKRLAATPEAELRAAMESARGGPVAPRQPEVRRLTHTQYNHTVRDLLGDFTRPADQFPQEDYLNGFTNQVEGQSIPPLLAEAYAAAAEELAENAFRRGAGESLIPCKPVHTSDPACRDQFIRRFGLKAFRRPLTETEVRGYQSLFNRAAEAAKQFDAGAQLVVEAMLQSPNFLFHLEAGNAGQWRAYGVASKLSYFLWDTMPDERLFRAAATGELNGEEPIRKTVRRMMDDSRTKRAFEVFLAQWMRFDRVLASARSVRRYPDFGASLLSAMTEETKHLFNHLVWNDLNFMELFNARYTFVSARLAQLYEMPSPAQDFERVYYPAGSTRAGVLGHAGFLTLTGNPNETSPTGRGLFIREQFLCQHVPPPPPGVDTNLPLVSPEKPMTTRQRLAEHASNPSCASCHSLIDPIGAGLEGFDNIGRKRDKIVLRVQLDRDSVTNQPREPKTFELPLDTNGFIQGVASSNFASAAELGKILSETQACQQCIVKQVFRYALGRHETENDKPHLETLYRTFQNSNFRFQALVLALVTSEPFLGIPRPPTTASAALRTNIKGR